MIAMAEQGQRAQIDETERAQNYTRDDARRGQLLGFAAMICAMVGGLICVGLGALTQSNGAYWMGAVFLSAPVMTLAKALIDSARISAANAKVENALLAAEGTQPPGPAESPTPRESPTP